MSMLDTLLGILPCLLLRVQSKRAARGDNSGLAIALTHRKSLDYAPVRFLRNQDPLRSVSKVAQLPYGWLLFHRATCGECPHQWKSSAYSAARMLIGKSSRIMLG